MKIQKHRQQRLLANMPSFSSPSLRFIIFCWFCWQSSESLSVSSILPVRQKGRANNHNLLTASTRNTIDFRNVLSRHTTYSVRDPSYTSPSETKLRKRRRQQRRVAITKSCNWRNIFKTKQHASLAWLRKLLLFQTNRKQVVRKLLPMTTSVLVLLLSCFAVQPQSAWAAVAMTSTAATAGTAAAATTTTIVPASVVISRQLEAQLCTRLVYSVLMGGLVGWERSAANHSAGVRTMSLVSLGAASFALLSVFGFEGCAHYDPSRMAANVASGVGFIGAGVITTQNLGEDPQSKEPNSVVKGLTTAAAIWMSAAVGLASGLGLYYISGIASVITVSILRIGRCKHSKWGHRMCQFVGIDPSLRYDDEYRTAPTTTAPLSSSTLSQRMQKDDYVQLKPYASFLPTTIPSTTASDQENADPSIRMTELDEQRKWLSSTFGNNCKDIQRCTNDRPRQYLEHPFNIQTTTATTRSETNDLSLIKMKRLTAPSLSGVKKSSHQIRKDVKKESLLSSPLSETKQLQDAEEDFLSVVDISSASSSSLGFDDDTSLALLPSPDSIPNLLSSASGQVERVTMKPPKKSNTKKNKHVAPQTATATSPTVVLHSGQNVTESSTHVPLGRSSKKCDNLAA